MIEDSVEVITMEKERLKYKGKVVENVQSFILDKIKEKTSLFDFKEDMNKNMTFTKFYKLENIIEDFKDLRIF